MENIDQRLTTIEHVQALLCGLIALQIVAKVVIFSRVLYLLRVVAKLLTLTERHGVATDKAASFIEEKVCELDKLHKGKHDGDSERGESLPAS